MKDAFVFVVASVLFLACTGPTAAQEIPLTPEMKNWEPVLGKWKGEFELRESPTGDWKKGSASVENRSGGFFLENRGTGELGGQQHSWIEIIGYDPIQRSYVSSAFNSDGGRAGVTSMDWSGTTLRVNFTGGTAEREVEVGRVTWEYSSDFNSVTATTELFTDGKWWIAGKIKGTKAE